jgi:hypothetical protein
VDVAVGVAELEYDCAPESRVLPLLAKASLNTTFDRSDA